MKFFDQFEKFERIHEKEFLFILMLKLFDTPNFNKLIHQCQRFKKILYEKIIINKERNFINFDIVNDFAQSWLHIMYH
jgi:hypothetical protein